MKTIDNLRHSFTCCFSPTTPTTTTTTSSSSSTTIKNRLSSTLTDLFKDLNFIHPHHQDQEEDHDSLIDAAASFHHHPPSPSHHHHRSPIFGTLFGRRRGHVTFCVQSDPTLPPPFLFDLPVPTHLLAKEMNSGLLRIALESHRAPPHHRHANPTTSPRHVWTAYCNGHKAGYAVRRKPSDRDRAILDTVKSMSAGAGVLNAGGGDQDGEGEMLYMRACYERVVGSRDSVSYHLINPGGSPDQELSVFLLRTGCS